MKFTVLGATGFIGGRLAQELRTQGYDVFTPMRGDPAIFSRDLGSVFYCVGKTADYGRDPFATFEAHSGMLVRLLSEGKFERLIYLSSTRLYDGLPVGNENAALSLSPLASRHLFDLTKAVGEHFTLLHAGGRGMVARLSCVYDGSPDATGFLPDLLRRLPRERDIILDASPDGSRDYIHINDTVAALTAIMTHGAGGGIYNVASGVNVRNREIAGRLATAGWKVGFAGPGVVTTDPPVVSVDKIAGLGIVPRSLMAFLDVYLEQLACSSPA